MYLDSTLLKKFTSAGVYKKKLPPINGNEDVDVKRREEEILTVAIKVLKPGLTIEAESDFEREIEILASFNHQNIVKLLGICRMSGISKH